MAATNEDYTVDETGDAANDMWSGVDDDIDTAAARWGFRATMMIQLMINGLGLG